VSSRARLRGLAVGLACLVLGACASPRPTLEVPRSLARVEAGPEASRLLELVGHLEPLVLEALGTAWPRPFVVRVAPVDGGRAETRLVDRRVSIDPGALDEGLPMTVAHELVHVHASGRWDGLPRGVEEGLAYWIAGLATGEHVGPYSGPEPDAGALLEALTATDEQYRALEPARRGAVHQAAAWLAAGLVPHDRLVLP